MATLHKGPGRRGTSLGILASGLLTPSTEGESHAGDGDIKERTHQGPAQRWALDKGFVNQATELTLWGKKEREVGRAREETNFIMMGLVTITFCPLNNLGLPSCSTVSKKARRIPSGGNRLILNYETRLPRADILSHTSSCCTHSTECWHDAPLMRAGNFPKHRRSGYSGDCPLPSPTLNRAQTLGNEWEVSV